MTVSPPAVPRAPMPLLVPYWIEFAPRDWFEVDEDEVSAPPRAFGVTAASLDATLALVRAIAYGGQPLPPVRRVVEGVDLAMLTMHNMSPGALPPGQVGVWYPAIRQSRAE
ncbi:MAG: hypothetical protein ACR2JW_10955 [Thermomicrobiales bacterium]